MSAGIETITPGDSLYRRFLHWYLKDDGTISSSAFMSRKKPDPELSVDLARLTTPEKTRASHLDMGVAEIAASVPLDMGLTVKHAPEHDNYAHCLIMGLKTKIQCRMLAEKASIRLKPCVM